MPQNHQSRWNHRNMPTTPSNPTPASVSVELYNQAVNDAEELIDQLRADRDALLAALKQTVNWVEAETDDRDWPHPVLNAARAAIKQAEERP